VVAGGKHLDVTNYYIGFGIGAGLLAILLVLAIIWRCLADVIEHVNDEEGENSRGEQFMIWCLGASLFSHAVSALSIAYFDQSQTFFWLSVATLSSLLAVHGKTAVRAPVADTGTPPSPGWETASGAAWINPAERR
jgi:hypothetical protein